MPMMITNMYAAGIIRSSLHAARVHVYVHAQLAMGGPDCLVV